MSSSLSRRSLLVAGTATALTAATYRQVAGANERIGVGFIGFGLIGKRHVIDFKEQPDVRCVAVSDAHRGRVEEAKALIGGDVAGHADFRKLLDDKNIQAIVVSTPDHWHALMTMLACAAGKDVYVEKPLSLFVKEGRWMTDVAAKHKSVVQVGTQQRSGPHYARARKLIQEGRIGKVHSVRMQSYRNIMPGFGAPADGPPPAELDWNAFRGPASARAYNPNRGIYHFRWFWDTSGGQMTNLGHHSLDIVHWFLGTTPLSVTSAGGRFCLTDNGETPDTQDALFEFATEHAAGTAQPGATCTAVWSHREASAGVGGASGLEFFGDKGSLLISRSGFRLTGDRKIPPENRVPQFTGAHPVGGPQRTPTVGPPQSWTTALEDIGNEREQFVGHVRNFLDCIKSRQTPNSDLASSHRVSTQCHLANLSLRLGRRLRWDAEREDIIDDAEASALLSRAYRAPWDAELRALTAS